MACTSITHVRALMLGVFGLSPEVTGNSGSKRSVSIGKWVRHLDLFPGRRGEVSAAATEGEAWEQVS